MKSIADQLKAYRKTLGLTQEELAKQSGVSLSSIRNIEQGAETNTATLAKLNKVLNYQFIIGE